MGQIADARARLAQAAAEEEQIRVKLEMSRRELGELEKRWKAVEREAGQGERDIKKMHECGGTAQGKGRCNALYTGTYSILFPRKQDSM